MQLLTRHVRCVVQGIIASHGCMNLDYMHPIAGCIAISGLAPYHNPGVLNMNPSCNNCRHQYRLPLGQIQE